MATSYYDVTEAVNREGTIYEQDAENVLENLEEENLQNNEIVQDENNEEHIKKVVCLLKEVLTSNNENHPNRYLKEVSFFL